MYKQFDRLKHPRMLYIVEEHTYLYPKVGMVIVFGSSSSINGSDETIGCELLPLSCVHSIKDGALTFCHVAREAEAWRDRDYSIVNRRLKYRHSSIEVHRAHLISAIITLQING